MTPSFHFSMISAVCMRLKKYLGFPTSNTAYRIDLSDSDRKKLRSEIKQCNRLLDQSGDLTMPHNSRHLAMIELFWVCQKMEILVPMYPKFRAMIQDKIREFEKKLTDPDIAMDKTLQVSLQEAMDAMKKSLANAHRSPFFVRGVRI